MFSFICSPCFRAVGQDHTRILIGSGRAQGVALVLVPVLTAFRSKIEAALIREGKLEPPDEVLHLLDQLYVLGVGVVSCLQMVSRLQANQRAEATRNYDELNVRSAYSSMARQRLGECASILRRCNRCLGEADACPNGLIPRPWTTLARERSNAAADLSGSIPRGSATRPVALGLKREVDAGRQS